MVFTAQNKGQKHTQNLNLLDLNTHATAGFQACWGSKEPYTTGSWCSVVTKPLDFPKPNALSAGTSAKKEVLLPAAKMSKTKLRVEEKSAKMQRAKMPSAKRVAKLQLHLKGQKNRAGVDHLTTPVLLTALAD